jgi:hypothetical protein
MDHNDRPPVIFLYAGIVSILIGLFLLFQGTPISVSSSPTSPSPIPVPVQRQSINVDSTKIWNDTGIHINKGSSVLIQSSGQINVGSPNDASDKWVSPDGWGEIPSTQWGCNGSPCRYKYAVNRSMGALIGKIGNGQPFFVGSNISFTANSSGNLQLGVNDVMSDGAGKSLSESELLSLYFSNNRGSFSSTVQVK